MTVNERASTAKQIVVKVMGWEAEYIDPSKLGLFR